MGDPPQDPSDSVALGVDWDAVSSSARRGLAARMGGFRTEDIEDSVQDACTAYFLFVRRNGAPPHSPESLLFKIVRGIAANAIRRRQRERAALSNPELGASLYSTDERNLFEALETTVFLLREYFLLKKAACAELADLRARDGSLKDHANAKGISHDTTRQDWSRCAKLIRDAVRSGRLRIPWMPPPPRNSK
jgi:DNA-directed RNA polymerase specialized sigma24 family protein